MGLPYLPHALSSGGYLQLFVTKDLSIKTFVRSEPWERNSLPCGLWSSFIGFIIVKTWFQQARPKYHPKQKGSKSHYQYVECLVSLIIGDIQILVSFSLMDQD